MNAKGEVYFLHSRWVSLRNTDKDMVIYWFARAINKLKVCESLPKGYEVIENERSGMPLLRKKKKMFGLF